MANTNRLTVDVEIINELEEVAKRLNKIIIESPLSSDAAFLEYCKYADWLLWYNILRLRNARNCFCREESGESDSDNVNKMLKEIVNKT